MRTGGTTAGDSGLAGTTGDRIFSEPLLETPGVTPFLVTISGMIHGLEMALHLHGEDTMTPFISLFMEAGGFGEGSTGLTMFSL